MASSSNGLDLDTLTRVLAQPKLAGAGAAGGGHPFMSALGYLGAAMRGVANTPQGSPGILGALGPVMELYNLRQYNKGLAEQAALERQQQALREQGIRQDRAGIGRQAGLNNYSGFADLPDAATLANIQGMNWQNDPNGLESLLQNGELTPVQGGAIPEKVLQYVLERAGKANDANATLGKLPAFMSNAIPGAQNPNEAPQMPTTAPGQTANAAFDNSPMLQAGVAQQEMVTPGNALQYGIPDVSQLLTGRQNEQQDRLGNRKASEDERKNKQLERLKEIAVRAQATRDQAAASLDNRTDPNQRSGGGGSGNPYTIPNAELEYQNKLTGQVRKQIADINSTLQAQGFVDKSGAPTKQITQYTAKSQWFDGKTYNPTKAAAAEQAMKLIQQRDELQGALIGGGRPFGGTSRGKIQAAGANAAASGFAAWKQGRK